MKVNSAKRGIGFCGFLTIAFIVLKLCNVINWSWLWVLSPMWIPVALIAVIFLGFLLIGMIFDKIGSHKKH